MFLFGTVLLVAATAMALLAVISYGLVIGGRNAALGYGRFGVLASLFGVAVSWLMVVALFAGRRFDIAYVYNYSSLDLDFFFTVAASWAGQPGSFLIWALFGALVAVPLIGRSRHFEPYVLAIVMTVQATLLIFVLILNPFSPMIDPSNGMAVTPADGSGLNALLHNFWMIIHPPILFLGYALAAVPFAFALAGLWRRDYDNWIARAMPWTLAAWSVLGLGLLLGGYWAYETLGWGGYWGWDPVENSSLVPWLLLTALLHGTLVQRSHGSLRRSNFVLAIFAFLTVFYATFLTRSGVYANFSVHSFVAEGIYGTLVAVLLLMLIGSMGLLVTRWRDIPGRPLSEKFFSRDSFFVLAILSIVTVTLVIGIGTSMPVISAIPGVGHTLQGWLGSTFEIEDGTSFGAQPFEDGRFSLAQSFYQRATPPLGLVIVALMIIGPLLGWRDSNLRHLLRALRWPAVLAVLAGIVAMLIGVRDPLSLAYVGLGSFAIGTNLLMLVRTLRSGWLRIGGYLAHAGFAVFLIGVVGSSAYATPDERLALSPGDTLSMYGFDFTFNSWKQTPDGKGVIDLTVQQGEGEPFSARPQLYFDQRMGSTMQTPSVHSYFWHDLYVSPAEYVPENDPARPVMGVGDTVVMGPYELTFTSFDIDMQAMMAGEPNPEVGATVLVRYEGEETALTPKLRLKQDSTTGEGSFEFLPVTMPGGHELSLETFDPTQRIVLLSAEGLDLPVVPARAVVTVSIKPLVVLVWVGVVTMMLGGFVAMARRYLESDARLRGVRLRLPRGLALPSRRRPGWRATGD
jgi:cytochrome c-type biogenesis protein CcmF